ncbi:MAG TPA: phosphoribosyltransferase family protein [Candidatus Tumulicola sp.]|jgi:predicted amidophosphoribosyltransferase
MQWRALLDFVFPAQCAACNGLGSGLCSICVPPDGAPLRVRVRGVSVTAHGWYEGALRAAIPALKDGRRDVAEALGERVAPLVERGAVLVPVPTSDVRRRVRGMDGVALVAERAAQLAAAGVLCALQQRIGSAQHGRSRSQRLAARGRFAAAGSLACRRVVLLDDVCTTGATLEDCVRAVAAAGGRVEGAVVVAATKTNARDQYPSFGTAEPN